MTEDRLLIGFDKSTENDKACLVVMRKEGRGCKIVKQFTGIEATEIYERLTGENGNGVLNKHIYSNDGFIPKEIELFEKIESVLGFKLFKWQKTFLIVGAFRQYGETTAIILRDLLAVKEPPLDLSTPKGAIERINREYYREMQERLTAAGIPTRTVFYSEREKKHYGKQITVSFIDDTGRR